MKRKNYAKLAKQYRGAGYFVLPKAVGKKRAAVRWTHLQNNPPSPEETKELFKSVNHDGIVLVTGKQSGFIVVDADNKAGIKWVLKNLKPCHSIITTPKGMHFYYGWDEPVKNAVNIFGSTNREKEPLIDIRGENGLVVIRHPGYAIPQRGKVVWARDNGYRNKKYPKKKIDKILSKKKNGGSSMAKLKEPFQAKKSLTYDSEQEWLSALFSIRPEEYDVWRDCLGCIKTKFKGNPEYAIELARIWSAGVPDKYNHEEFRSVFDSLNKTKHPEKIIYRYANSGRWSWGSRAREKTN